MTDTELSKITGIPSRTLTEWKSRDTSNYRFVLYNLISTMNKEDLKNKIESIRNLFKENKKAIGSSGQHHEDNVCGLSRSYKIEFILFGKDSGTAEMV